MGTNLGWMALGLKSDLSNVTDAVYWDNSGLSSMKGIQLLDNLVSTNKIVVFYSESESIIQETIWIPTCERNKTTW